MEKGGDEERRVSRDKGTAGHRSGVGGGYGTRCLDTVSWRRSKEGVIYVGISLSDMGHRS